MLELDLISEPIFSFYMDRIGGSEESRLVFGPLDESLYDGEVHYHKVVEKMFWSIEC